VAAKLSRVVAEPTRIAADSRPRRAHELDLLRLVAAVGVVLYHLTWHAWAVDGTSRVRFPAAVTAVTRYGFLGVELFFLISGMVVLSSATNRTAREFAASRVARLFPAYWAMVTLTFVVTHLAHAHRLTVGPGDWLVNLTMVEELLPHRLYQAHLVDGVYWTLTLELVFYALVWVTLLARQLHRIVGVLALWLALAALVELAHVGPTGTLRRYAAVEFAPLFVVGACCGLLGVDRRRWSVWALFVISVPFAAHQTMVSVADADRSSPGAHHPWIGAVATLVFVAIVLAVALGWLRWLGRRWMLTAGLLTYPLYLVHENVGIVVLDELDGVDRWLALLGVLTLVVALARAVHVWVERPLAPRLRRAVARHAPVPVDPRPDGSASVTGPAGARLVE
jgi:peptidoglycan/LPS O-acetylase OafA/YrhL